jgi:uncharacterized protein YqgC (DUF456 family)
MDSLQPITTLLVILAMAVAFLLSFIPILPGPVIPWVVGVAFGILNGWERLTPAAALVMTALMVIGATADIWRPLLGAKTGGMTCRTSLGSIIGGIAGTVLIPIPLLGTLIGCIAGALVVELLQFGDLRRALAAGRVALKLFIVGYALNIALSFAILLTFLISLLTTA